MSRPYFKKSIYELEAIFSGADGNPRVLKRLQEELEHRKTPRAISLRRKVRAALNARLTAHQGRDRPSPSALRGGTRTKLEIPRAPVQRPTSQAAEDDESESSLPPKSGTQSGVDSGSETGIGVSSAANEALKEPTTPVFARPASSLTSPHDPVSVPDIDHLLAGWTTLEVLEPQPLPKPKDLTFGRRLIRTEDQPEPWNVSRYRRQGRESAVYWFVYLGELDLSAALSSLLSLFPDDSPEPPPKPRGSTTLAVVVLDGKGRPVEDRTFLSSFAWGYGKVRSGDLRKLVEFSNEERRLCSELESRLIRTDDEGEIQPVTSTDLDRVTDWLLGALNLPAKQVSTAPVSIRAPVWGRYYEAPEPELLNSFFLEDLSRVRAAFRDGDVGAALKAFVTGKPARPQVDVVRDQEALDEAIAPRHIPLCRWPVRGRYPLVMMQQAAVNQVARELATPGLVGINGPPGTGKTTLLRDVVAKVVLDRSIALAEFEDPSDAFSHVSPMAAGRGFVHLYRLEETLLGHEVVVASSNNKAVENISREIPALDAVADDLEPPLRYFSSVADRVFHEGREDNEIESTCWGLAAAVLGNSSNRNDFSNRFWWDRQRSMQKYLRGIAEGWTPAPVDRGGETTEEGEESPPEVLMMEDAPRDRPEALKRWRDTQTRFREALERAEDQRAKLEEARRALHQRSHLEGELGELSATIEALQEEVASARVAAETAARNLERAQRRTMEAVAERTAQEALRPGFFARLFSTRGFREWRDRMAEKMGRVERCQEDELASEVATEAAQRKLAELEGQLQRKEATRKVLERQLARIRAVLASASTELGEQLPDDHFWSRPEEERQKLSPWLGEAFQAARDDLFKPCFELHRAFIDAAAQPLRHNLSAAMMLLKGRQLTEKQEPARRSIWASLFLTVPVVSTTFASVARMFGPLGSEQLGWLLIDEAGQAVPQAAVGAMWRAERVVGIGDPMQLQPVVTLPQRLTDAVLGDFGVEPEAWSAPLNSVQSLADRASWFGTTLRHEAGDTWVGSPLRVHRRCEEPMFGISNNIAYDGLMVQATPESPSGIGDVLGPSGWFHVESDQAGHWSDAEGELAARLLSRVFEAGIFDPNLFFISPFRIVQNRLRSRFRKLVEGHVNLSPWQWTQEYIGTIPVFQGKEAEAVVLVLGAPTPQDRGARWWAGAVPNLLNVAASRAKKRLYVIGDRANWRDAGVFRTLAKRLPRRDWKEFARPA